jgi:hypothetical protein
MSRILGGLAVRRAAAAMAAVGVVMAGGLTLRPGVALASSHREAPAIAGMPQYDNTDVYAFVPKDRAGYVTFVCNFFPFEEPNGGPNFYPWATDATYNIKVDNDGDAKPDALFQFSFTNDDRRGNNTFLYNNGPVTSLDDPNLLFRQKYTLKSSFNGEPLRTRVSGGPVAPSNTGPASFPDYGKVRQQAFTQLPGGWKIFVGQANDPFFLDLRVFDLLYGGNLSEVGQNTLAGYNVNTIVLQVPFKDVALRGDATRNPVIGMWSTVERNRVVISGSDRGVSDNRAQVSRLGNPLVNEVVVPAGLKNAFNAIGPDKDAGIPAVVQRVTDPELPKLIQAIYGVPAPATPRNDLVEIFLTGITKKLNGPIKADLNSQLNNMDVDPSRFRPSEMLRLNLSVKPTDQPNRLGVLAQDFQGFPNGRRLTDDVVDIELQAVEGAAQSGKLVDALAKGDGVDSDDAQVSNDFPYVALPSNTAVNGGTAAAPAANAPTDAPGADPSTTPAAFSTGQQMIGTSTAVAIAASAVSVALAVLLLIGWRQRRKVAVVSGRGGSEDRTVQL